MFKEINDSIYKSIRAKSILRLNVTLEYEKPNGHTVKGTSSIINVTQAVNDKNKIKVITVKEIYDSINSIFKFISTTSNMHLNVTLENMKPKHHLIKELSYIIKIPQPTDFYNGRQNKSRSLIYGLKNNASVILNNTIQPSFNGKSKNKTNEMIIVAIDNSKLVENMNTKQKISKPPTDVYNVQNQSTSLIYEFENKTSVTFNDTLQSPFNENNTSKVVKDIDTNTLIVDLPKPSMDDILTDFLSSDKGINIRILFILLALVFMIFYAIYIFKKCRNATLTIAEI